MDVHEGNIQVDSSFILGVYRSFTLIISDGDVSTVDVLFPSSPLFFYLNPEALRLLLLPVLAYANNETNIPYDLAWFAEQC